MERIRDPAPIPDRAAERQALRIYRKLEVANRIQAIDRAQALGILQARSHVRMLRPQDALRRRRNDRPLAIDTHDHIEGLIADAFAQAHAADLESQEKYGVMYLRYWFDETSDMVCYFVEVPNKEAAVVAALVGDWQSARDVQLVLPETGVCSSDSGASGCCAPAAAEPRRGQRLELVSLATAPLPRANGLAVLPLNPSTTANSCCAPAAQASCCAPEEKDDCCGSGGTSCGCDA